MNQENENNEIEPNPIDPSKPWPQYEDEEGRHVVNDQDMASALLGETETDQHGEEETICRAETAYNSDEPTETEETPEITSEADGDYEVFGSDETLVNHVVSVIQSLGKTATVHSDAAGIQGGKTIVLCGNDWDAFVASCSANSGKNLVIQFNHDGARFRSTDAGIRCGTNIISYDLEELKSEVAQRALPML